MLDGREAKLGGGEFLLLQLHKRAHLMPGVAVRQLEHSIVQRVEPRQGNELELVAHGAKLALERLNSRVIQILLPVERRRAVIGQHLARKLAMDRLGEFRSEEDTSELQSLMSTLYDDFCLK